MVNSETEAPWWYLDVAVGEVARYGASHHSLVYISLTVNCELELIGCYMESGTLCCP